MLLLQTFNPVITIVSVTLFPFLGGSKAIGKNSLVSQANLELRKCFSRALRPCIQNQQSINVTAAFPIDQRAFPGDLEKKNEKIEYLYSCICNFAYFPGLEGLPSFMKILIKLQCCFSRCEIDKPITEIAPIPEKYRTHVLAFIFIFYMGGSNDEWKTYITYLKSIGR